LSYRGVPDFAARSFCAMLLNFNPILSVRSRRRSLVQGATRRRCNRSATEAVPARLSSITVTGGSSRAQPCLDDSGELAAFAQRGRLLQGDFLK